MSRALRISRRKFIASASLATAAAAVRTPLLLASTAAVAQNKPLRQFGYGDVTLASELHEKPLHDMHALLMDLSDDSLLKPLRAMSGQPAPGEELGGWYLYNPGYDWHKDDAGFAPACTFGQWVSSLARMYAITGAPETRAKVLRLNRLYAKTITADFYKNNRFPAYCYDKFVCGLMDSHEFAHDPDAFKILELTTDTALPNLPGQAIEHGKSWRPGTDESFTWDESYTNSENLFIAYQRGAGARYRKLGEQYLDDEYYGPLSEGRNNLAGRHAYSHVNSLSSAMQAYLTLGSEKHLRAAKTGFDMVLAQSFVTGGWGPDETLRGPDSDDVASSLENTHHSFETPCGSYAHFKLTRYLLRVTREPRYGDSMERIMYNAVLGAKPMQRDGRTFYYADYNRQGSKVYSDHRWPCCSGTHPQVAADYRINTYFRDARGLYVNLYIPSTVRWMQDSVSVSLKQDSAYPLESVVGFEVQTSKPVEFTLNCRIPEWAEGASLSLNGRRTSTPVNPGTFAAMSRTWRQGDRVELDLPLKLRLESLDARHPQTVALLSGPLVLFATGGGATTGAAKFTRQQLLSAKKTSAETWAVATSAGSMKMLPFTAIEEEPYSTYLRLS